MSSIREQILARIVTVLGALPNAVPVFRSRETAFARAQLPAVVVVPVDEETQPLSELWEVSQFNFHVEVLVRGDVWDSLADPIIVAAHTLMLGDAQLAALCSKIRRSGAKWEGHEADQTAGVLTQVYHVQYLGDTTSL